MSLEIRKLELQLAQVAIGRQSNEVRILEMLESIARIEKDIEISKAKEAELQKQIEEKKKG
jgi:hypothetical protein